MTPEERAEKVMDELWRGIRHADDLPTQQEHAEAIAAAVKEAVAAERGACAEVAREMGPTFFSKEMREAADAIARAIEARGRP